MIPPSSEADNVQIGRVVSYGVLSMGADKDVSLENGSTVLYNGRAARPFSHNGEKLAVVAASEVYAELNEKDAHRHSPPTDPSHPDYGLRKA